MPDQTTAPTPPPGWTVSAAIPGAWTSVRSTAGRPAQEITSYLERFAALVPVTAHISERGGTVALLRDPSATRHNPPSVAYRRADAAQWTWRERIRTPHDLPVTAILGLRVGYDPDAPVHQPAEALDLLDAQPWRHWAHATGRTLSLRSTAPGEPLERYEEPALLLMLPAGSVSALVDVAARLGQHRFAVTDASLGLTYALRRTDEEVRRG